MNIDRCVALNKFTYTDYSVYTRLTVVWAEILLCRVLGWCWASRCSLTTRDLQTSCKRSVVFRCGDADAVRRWTATNSRNL